MKAIGIVQSLIDDNSAIVVSKWSSACDSCHNCSVKGKCHAELVFGDRSESVSVEAVNLAKASVGDKVELESNAYNILISLFALFILPLILTVPFYFILNIYFSISNVLPLLLIAVFVFLFVVCAFLMNYFMRNRPHARIVRIIEESKDSFERE